ncbi:MAG: BatD family protein [Planctomycetota bacterium]|nr:BatD family protein [Planctomycetota bacterium]MEC8413938.1 BatD family protein [Planctomycetota bacterium]
MLLPLFVLLTSVPDIDWVVSPSVADAGIPFEIQVRLQGEGRSAPDLDVPTPEVLGLEMLEGPDVRSGSNLSIVNGRTSAAWTRTFTWTVVADSPGLYQLPEVVFTGSELDFRVNPGSVVVRELEPSRDVFVELRCSNLTPWIDQIVDLELTVLFRPFQDEDLGTRIGSQDLVQLIDWNRSALGPFSNILDDQDRRRGQFVRGRGEQQGWEGFRWTVSKRFRSAGDAVLEPVRLIGTYPVSLVRRNTVFGSSIQIAKRRPVRVDTNPLEFQVRPPPQDGKPEDWVGAVGRFSLSTSLDRVSLGVGEPVTLTMRVEDLDGNADLARLPDPPIEQQLQDAGWQLSPDPAPGKVEGQVRTIRRSIRPTERADKLPRLRLPYFDAESSEWGVTVAEAIQVQVTAVSQLDIQTLPTPLVEAPQATLEVGPETWPGLAEINPVPWVTAGPLVGGLGLGLVLAGVLRWSPLLFLRRGLSQNRKLDLLLRELKRAQGHIQVGQAARAYLSAWSNHASDPIVVLRKSDPQLADELQEAFVALDRADFGGGSIDAGVRIIDLLRRLPGRKS